MFLPDQPPPWPKTTSRLPQHGSQPFHWPWPPPRLLHSRAGQSQREWWSPQSPHLPKTRASPVPAPGPAPLRNLGMPRLCHSFSYRVFCPCCSSCLRLTSTFLCVLRPRGSWWPPGLSSSTACGLKKAITSPPPPCFCFLFLFFSLFPFSANHPLCRRHHHRKRNSDKHPQLACEGSLPCVR